MISSMLIQIKSPLRAFKRSMMEHVASDYRNIDCERLDRDAEGIIIRYTDDTRDDVRVSGLSIA